MPTTIDGNTGVSQTSSGAKQNGTEGEVCWFARSTAPAGFLKANGAAVSRTTYAALFAAIGTTWGAGDGSTTFNVPDLRGEFVRGFDDGRGVDSGRSFGSAQAGSTVQGDWYGASGAGAGSRWWGDLDSTSNLDSQGIATMSSGSWGAIPDAGKPISSILRTTGLARPRNIALLACIRF
jgi:phage-related tail fiber protein